MDKVSDSLKKTYDNIADEFSPSRVFPWPELQVFIPYLADDSKILDLGCGNGRIIKLLKDNNKSFNYLGVDFSEKLIAQAKQNFPPQEFKLADMREVEFAPASFDFIIIIAAFHHLVSVKERKELLTKIHQWLKPGGLLFMTNWNLFQPKYLKYIYAKFWRKKAWNDFYIPWNKKNYRFYHSFTKMELEILLKKAGFTLEPKGVYQTEFNINVLVRK